MKGGEATTSRVSSPETDRRTIFSREKKSIFRKKKNSDSPVTPHDGSKLEVTVSGKEEKKHSPKLSKKSFKKVAKIVKLSGGVRKSHKKSEIKQDEEEEELDRGEQSIESGSEEATSPAHSQTVTTSSEQQDSSGGPNRPSDITFRQTSIIESVATTASNTPSSLVTSSSGSVPYVQRSSSSSSDDFVHVPLPPQAATPEDSSRPNWTKSKTSQTQKSPSLPKLSETRESPSSPPPTFSTRIRSHVVDGEEEFFSINEMHICICGQWLCVSNTGGVVMAFDFQLKNSKKALKVRLM